VTALFVFDMDGTLLPGSTPSLELAGALGSLDALQALDARFTAGSSTPGASRQRCTGSSPACAPSRSPQRSWRRGCSPE